MRAFGTISRATMRSRHLPLIGFLLVGLMLISAGFRTWEARETIVSSYRREITNLSIALAAQAGRSLQAVDLVVRETQREATKMGTAGAFDLRSAIASEDLPWFLARHSKNLPQADVIGL